jgi:PAS domain S-box-containing protein
MKSKKIVNKLLLWFLFIALVPLTSVTAITYFIANASQTKEVKNNLVSIAESKAKQLENYLQERQNNAKAIAQIPTIIDAIEKYETAFETYGINSPEYQNLDKKYRQFLNGYLEIFGYSNIYLISQSGDAIFSVKKGKELGANYYGANYKNSEIAKVFDRAKTLMQVEVSNFGSLDGATNQPAAYIAAPVFKKNLIIGVVVLQLNQEQFNKVVNDYTGLGKSGETIVGSVVGSQIVFISPTRHDPNAAFRRTVKVDKEKVHPLDKASHGQKGIGITLDYQGKETVAAWRYLPSLNGGILVKINTSEAFSSLIALRRVVIVLGLITLCVVILAAFAVAKSISKPVVKLTQVVQDLARGNLNQQAPVLTHDEIGQLAQSFNFMGKKLQESFNIIKAREQELATAKEQLEAVLDAVPGSISWFDSGGLYIGVNRYVAENWNISQDAFIGKEVGFLKGSSLIASFMRDFFASEEEAASQLIEVEVNDSPKYYLIAAQKYQKGKATVSVGIDVTERKKAEEALRIAEENYRSIFENALEGIFQSQLDGRFISVNPAMARIYGYDSPSEMIASIHEIDTQIYVDPNCREKFAYLMEETGKVKDLEYQIYRRDGSIIWVQENTRAVRDTSGKLLYYEGIVQDISDRKRREDELKRQLAELKVEIDHNKREQEVALITKSGYFQELQSEISSVNLDEFWE